MIEARRASIELDRRWNDYHGLLDLRAEVAETIEDAQHPAVEEQRLRRLVAQIDRRINDGLREPRHE